MVLAVIFVIDIIFIYGFDEKPTYVTPIKIMVLNLKKLKVHALLYDGLTMSVSNAQTYFNI